MKPNKRRKRLALRPARRASSWRDAPPSGLALSNTPCDVCGASGTRPVGQTPLCWSCAILLTEAALHATDNGGTPEQADAFAWKYLRDERGQQKG